MNKWIVAVLAEWLKIRKSNIFIISIAAMGLLPLVCGLFLVILLHPELAGSSMLAQKAQIMGATNWASYFDLLNQMISVGGILIFGFVTSWTFGREYSDRTAKDLFALPIPRSAIVVSKHIAIAIWCLLLTIIAMVVAVALGFIINPPGFSFNILLTGIGIFIITALLNILLITPVSFFASFGKGYLSPLGFIIFTILLGQLGETLGLGAYYPWNMPAIYAGVAHDDVSVVGYLIFAGTVILGFGATLAWWRYADQK